MWLVIFGVDLVAESISAILKWFRVMVAAQSRVKAAKTVWKYQFRNIAMW